MWPGQHLVNMAGKGNLLTPGRKFMMGEDSIEFCGQNSVKRAKSRRMAVWGTVWWLLKSFLDSIILAANAHPGEERAVCETLAQVNLITSFGLSLLWDPSESRPKRRESIWLVVKEGKHPQPHQAWRNRSVGRWQVERDWGAEME